MPARKPIEVRASPFAVRFTINYKTVYSATILSDRFELQYRVNGKLVKPHAFGYEARRFFARIDNFIHTNRNPIDAYFVDPSMPFNPVTET